LPVDYFNLILTKVNTQNLKKKNKKMYSAQN